jgi:hypothetical protein
MQELEVLQSEQVSLRHLEKTLADLESLAALEDLQTADTEALEKEYAAAEKAIGNGSSRRSSAGSTMGTARS